MNIGRVLGVLALAALVACTPPATQPPGTTPPLETRDLGPLDIPTEIVVIGDFGSGSGGQYDVAETMREVVADRDVELLLTTGDNFYSDDVAEIWDEPYGWLASEGIPVAAAWGNHDIETPTRLALVQQKLNPPGRWYAVPLGEGKLIVLDSNQVDNEEQIDWLRSELEAAGSPVIISFHHPAFSCGVYADYDLVRNTWIPIIQPYDVTLVLSGHEHHYERFEVAGNTYVVTGGGGQRIRDRRDCAEGVPDPLVGDYQDQHFVILTVTSTSIEGEAIDVDGQTIDTFRVEY